jgi:hypothetical protein
MEVGTEEAMEADTEVVMAAVTVAAGTVEVGMAEGAGIAVVAGMAAVFASRTSITAASSMAATIRPIIPIIITAAR